MTRRHTDTIVELMPPPWLSKAAKPHFKRWAKQLADSNVSTMLDAGALCELAEVAAELARLREAIALHGDTYTLKTVTGGEMIRLRPEVQAAASASKRLKGLLDAFGLNPKARRSIP